MENDLYWYQLCLSIYYFFLLIIQDFECGHLVCCRVLQQQHQQLLSIQQQVLQRGKWFVQCGFWNCSVTTSGTRHWAARVCGLDHIVSRKERLEFATEAHVMILSARMGRYRSAQWNAPLHWTVDFIKFLKERMVWHSLWSRAVTPWKCSESALKVPWKCPVRASGTRCALNHRLFQPPTSLVQTE